MQDLLLFSFAIMVSAAILWLADFQKKRAAKVRMGVAADKHLWGSLAAGLFDAAECPPHARLEITLAAVSSKLKLRGALVTLQGRDTFKVLASYATEGNLIEGLFRGSVHPRSSTFCSHLTEKGQAIAIDYASLSSWRAHPAYFARGWECYTGLNCGLHEGEDLVVAFFDPSPRAQIFSASEKLLVEQLAPWILTMIDEEAPKNYTGAAGALLVPPRLDSSILE